MAINAARAVPSPVRGETAEMARARKRSLTLRGHRTSVTLEDEFWDALKDIADSMGISATALASEIDGRRDFATGLASSIRVFVLKHYRHSARGTPSGESQPNSARKGSVSSSQ